MFFYLGLLKSLETSEHLSRQPRITLAPERELRLVNSLALFGVELNLVVMGSGGLKGKLQDIHNTFS